MAGDSALPGEGAPRYRGAWDAMMTAETFARAVDELADAYRDRCLWFLRRDYYPPTDEARLQVLGYIERYGDLAAFRRAAELRQWLSPPSNATSAAS